jgi:UDP-N-acetylmuramoyl-tripeptide--D-alanyl-D-alanine ligase
VDLLLAVGDHAAELTDGAISAGMRGDHVHRSLDVEGAWDVLQPLLLPGDLVLLKGSRRVGLEELVERLRELTPASGGEEG